MHPVRRERRTGSDPGVGWGHAGLAPAPARPPPARLGLRRLRGAAGGAGGPARRRALPLPRLEPGAGLVPLALAWAIDVLRRRGGPAPLLLGLGAAWLV